MSDEKIEYFDVRLPLSKLRLLDTAEVYFLLGLGHVANELAVVRKTSLAATDGQATNEFGEAHRVVCGMTLALVLCGKVREAWRIADEVSRSPLFNEKYLGRFSMEDVRTLERIRDVAENYKDSPVLKARNELAFHFQSMKNFDADLAMVESDARIFLSENPINCLQFSASQLAYLQFARDLDASSMEEALTKTLGDAIEISDLVCTFANKLIAEVVKEHFPGELSRALAEASVHTEKGFRSDLIVPVTFPNYVRERWNSGE